MNINTKKFISNEELNSLNYSIIPKLLNLFEGKQRQLWEHSLSKFTTHNFLPFNNENDYLENIKNNENTSYC